jgi:EmrB/QacA subfamily drug resistance transporter
MPIDVKPSSEVLSGSSHADGQLEINSPPGMRRWWVLLAVGMANLMGTLNSSIVITTLPTIGRELHAEVATIEWVVTMYLVVVSGFLLPFGRLGDLRGHKRVYTIGFIVFGMSSLLCGLAWSASFLILARALQGLGSGTIFATCPAILTRNFPSSQRGQAMGLAAVMTYLGMAIGPALGGWLADSFGWRSVFYVNIPVCLTAIVAGSFSILKDEPKARGEKFDFLGAALFLAGLMAIILGLNQGHAWGWRSFRITSLLAVGIALLALFVLVERRTTHPMLDPSLFRVRLFSATVAGSLLNYMSVYSIFFLIPFYLIQGRGLSTSRAGLLSTVQPVLMTIVAPISGTLSDRIGTRQLSMLGMGLLSLGIFLASLFRPDTPLGWVVVVLGMAGLGMGIFIIPNTSAMMGAAPPHRQGIAGGVLATARTSGIVLGVGVAGAIFTTYLERGTPAALFDGVRAGLLVGALFGVIGCAVSAVRAPEATAQHKAAAV